MRKVLLLHSASKGSDNKTLSEACLATPEEALAEVRRVLSKALEPRGLAVPELPVPTESVSLEYTNTEAWRGSWVVWCDNPTAGAFPEEGRLRLLLDGEEFELPSED